MRARPDPASGPFLASMARLQAAGLIDTVVHDERTGEGWVSFTPACLRLLQAGRSPFAEEGFVGAWMTGDPWIVRAWVEREAALLPPHADAAGQLDTDGQVHGDRQ